MEENNQTQNTGKLLTKYKTLDFLIGLIGLAIFAFLFMVFLDGSNFYEPILITLSWIISILTIAFMIYIRIKGYRWLFQGMLTTIIIPIFLFLIVLGACTFL